ncbi:MAG: hypothetical protein CFE46_03900 [Burkholderiales bacterium PBB6]|nr:MAG: hypothetical protein CFE46_03900 [Burkholderiales bacterium PBB6]
MPPTAAPQRPAAACALPAPGHKQHRLAGLAAITMAALSLGLSITTPAHAIGNEVLQAWWRDCLHGGGTASAQAPAQAPAPVPVPLECLQIRETRALTEASGSVSRNAARLTVQRPDAPPVAFTDDSTSRHHFLGAVDELQASLVLQQGPEQPARVWLVPAQGQPLKLDNLPVPAPGGRLLAVVGTGEVVVGDAPGSATSRISLWQRAGARWSRQFSFSAPEGVQFQWRSWRADAAAARLDWQRQGHCGPSQGSVQLRDGPYGWELYPEPPAACR